MLYSLLRVIVFGAIVIGLGWAAVWLLNADGQVQIQLNNRENTFTIFEAILIAGAAFLGFWLLLEISRFILAVFDFISGDKNAINRFFVRRRQQKGVAAVTTAFTALARDDSNAALKAAKKADKYLDEPRLTELLTAQAAMQAGDQKLSEQAYKKLLSHSDTRLAAIRGLTKQRLDAGDHETALKLAQKAFEMDKTHRPTINQLFKLQSEQGRWGAARETLRAKISVEKLPKDVAVRREAVLALSEAQEAHKSGDIKRYKERAELANRLSPGLVPAAVLNAAALAEDKNTRGAEKALIKAWSINPHPDLAAAYAQLEPNETPEARLNRFSVLLKRQADNPETKLLKAELNLAAENFPEARRALEGLAAKAPTARYFALMAAVERGEGADDTIVRGYLARAITASRGAQWVCDNCHDVHPEWQPICSECGSFDTLGWVVPAQKVEEDDEGGNSIMAMLFGSDDKVEDADIVSVVEDKMVSDAAKDAVEDAKKPA